MLRPMRDRDPAAPDTAALARARAALSEAKQVAVMTGAGMSVRETIPFPRMLNRLRP